MTRESPLAPFGPRIRAIFLWLRRDRGARLGLALVLAVALFSALGPLVAGHDPNAIDAGLAREGGGAPPGPSGAHWLGTDALFRDVFARLAHGGRISLAVALAAAAVSAAVGTAVGLTAGLAEGSRARILDAAVLRLVDLLLALPFLLSVAAVGALVGRADVGTLLAILGLTGWTGMARVVRAKTIEVKGRTYVLAARALGAGQAAIARRHVLPALAGTVAVFATTSVAHMILAEALLSYLTVGVQPPRATWGRMLHEAEPFLLTRPLLVAAPAAAIVLTVIGFARLGEGLERALGAARRGVPEARGRAPADLLVVAAALLVVLALSSPPSLRPPRNPGASAGAAPRAGGVLRLATNFPLRNLEPAVAYDEGFAWLAAHVFARLVRWDASGKLVPDLAERFEIDEGGRAIRFFLRPGLRFHDGSELRAADVKRSIERALHPRTPSPAASHYAAIRGFEAFQAGERDGLEGVRVTGERSLTIHLDEPDATLLPLLGLAFVAPVCPASGAYVDPSRPAPPCGAGPYRVAAEDGAGGIRLERHDLYFDRPRPYIDAIDLDTGVRPSTQRYLFESGELDYVRELSSSDAALFRADPAWRGQQSFATTKAVHGLFLNTERAPFTSRHVRRAVAYAIDASVLERIRTDVAATHRMLPASVPRPPRDEPLRRHDLGRALEEMRAAGYPFDPVTGEGGYPEPIEFLAVPESFDQQAAEVYQAQLAKIGIRLRLRLVSFAAYLAEASRRGAVAAGVAGWGADFPDPSTFFEPILTTQAIRDEGSQNYAFFSNPELDALVARAKREPEAEARLELYGRAEEIVAEEAPWIPTYVHRQLEVWQPRLRGYAPHAVVLGYFVDAWLDPAPVATRAARAFSAGRIAGPGGALR